MGRARGEIHEERLVRRERLLELHPGDGLVGHVGHEVVAGVVRRGDAGHAVIERGIPLVGLAAEEPVEFVEARARRPAVGRSGDADLPGCGLMVLAEERGACPDAAEYGIKERFSNKTAIAPTASISIICGGSSPGIEPIAANSFTHKTLSGSFNVRNKYLKKILEKYKKDTDDVWSSITTNQGSVSHLEFLTAEEKDTFKTAFEIDQRWIIELGADRTPHISQAQSINVFIPADIHKKELHDIHFQAWKKGLKSLYYCRSKSIQRAENVNKGTSTDVTKNVYSKENESNNKDNNYEECLSCQ